MTHTVYFFHLVISLFSPRLIGLLFFSKCAQEKTLVAIILSFQKIKQEVRDLLGPKTPKKEKNYFEPCFQLFKKIDMGQLEKRQQFILVKKKKKQSQQSEIQFFRMLKTLNSFLYWNSNLKKVNFGSGACQLQQNL